MAKFAFCDLNGFMDFVGFVKLCSPDMFPQRIGVADDEQWTLKLAFEGIWYGFELLSAESPYGDSPIWESCKALTREAEKCYRKGDNRGGFFKLQQVEDLLASLKKR